MRRPVMYWTIFRNRACCARSKIIGYAWVDYFRNDFNEIQRLHGMSAIRKTQILDVMEKIKEIYYSKNTRNLVMNADEFRYLLQNTTSEEDSSIDNRLKIVLLMIEKILNVSMVILLLCSSQASIWKRISIWQ